MDTIEKNYIALLTPDYRAFLNSSFLHDLAGTFGDAHDFNPNQIEKFKEELLLFALFIYSESEFAERLSTEFDLDTAEARILTTALLQTFPDNYSRLHSQVIDALAAEEEVQTEPPKAAVAANLSNEIAETEAVLNTVKPIRTMSDDMEVSRPAVPETVHTGASQEDLLRRTDTSTNDPIEKHPQ